LSALNGADNLPYLPGYRVISPHRRLKDSFVHPLLFHYAFELISARLLINVARLLLLEFVSLQFVSKPEK